MSIASWVYTALLLCGITLMVVYARTEKLFKCVLFTLASGFAALGAVILTSGLWGLSIAFTPLTALVSGLLGIPGVIGILILNLI